MKPLKSGLVTPVEILHQSYVTPNRVFWNSKIMVILFISRCFFKLVKLSLLYFLFSSLQRLKYKAFVIITCNFDFMCGATRVWACSDHFLYLLQPSSTLLYSDHVFSDHMTVHNIRNCVSPNNKYTGSLSTEIRGWLTGNRKYTPISVKSNLMNWCSWEIQLRFLYISRQLKWTVRICNLIEATAWFNT